MTNNIKMLRRAAGLSQKELAAKCGVSQHRISSYERGGDNNGNYSLDRMSYGLALKLSAALGCTMEQLSDPLLTFDPAQAPDIVVNEYNADKKDLQDGNADLQTIINNRFM